MSNYMNQPSKKRLHNFAQDARSDSKNIDTQLECVKQHLRSDQDSMCSEYIRQRNEFNNNGTSCLAKTKAISGQCNETETSKKLMRLKRPKLKGNGLRPGFTDRT